MHYAKQENTLQRNPQSREKISLIFYATAGQHLLVCSGLLIV